MIEPGRERSVVCWTPSSACISEANLTRFRELVTSTTGKTFDTFQNLYDWSIQESEAFWKLCLSFLEIKTSTPYSTVLENPLEMPGARWFPGATLNFAENLLQREDGKAALRFWDERGLQVSLSFKELKTQVANIATFLRDQGVGPGDRVAALLPNRPETIVAMLAASSCGAIFSSCAPSFGVQGILDRFGQIEPTVLFVSDGYFYGGKSYNISEKVTEVRSHLPGLRSVVSVPYVTPDQNAIHDSVDYRDLVSQSAPDLLFEQLPFDHPLYIMFSSGTTGKPKCMVHGQGGTLLEHLKEHVLHTDVKEDDVVFYQTNCGWMMWNWLVSGLATGATLVLYDGNPMLDDGKILWSMAQQERITVFGTNAKYLSLIEKEGVKPGKTHSLPELRAILSTGSVLVPESFDYVYRDIKEDLCLSSISGGTDIIGCFALGAPVLPVHRGELQTRSLGYAVDVFDSNGSPVIGEKGELVCTAPFPSMPVCFWNDPDGERYRKAYFSRFPGVWHHGDYVELRPNGGMIFYGRSDAVLNPGGVRIGTAEIYRVVEQLPEILESVAVGQRVANDVRVILFVRLIEGAQLTNDLKADIKTALRQKASPFHVPAEILEVSDIPRTRSGKIAELAVSRTIHGESVDNSEALVNPESIEQFSNRL